MVSESPEVRAWAAVGLVLGIVLLWIFFTWLIFGIVGGLFRGGKRRR